MLTGERPSAARPPRTQVAPFQLYLLNLSLAAGQATFAVPLYISLLMLFMSFFGGAVFDEYKALLRPPMPLYAVLYFFGCTLVALGLVGLSMGQRRRQQQEKRVAADEPEIPPHTAFGGIDLCDQCNGEEHSSPGTSQSAATSTPEGSDRRQDTQLGDAHKKAMETAHVSPHLAA